MEGEHRVFDTVEDFVEATGGTKVIKKVLLANNGIAAVKEIRSVRKWAYATFGDEHAIEFVAMATPEDIAINAEYIRMADHFEAVPGGSNVNNYANVSLIVEIAERTGVQAVWAGWGHASENPKLPTMLKAAGIAFIGPPAQAMNDLGDKICSTIIAQSADVSCVPWSGDGIKVNYKESGGISAEVAERANVRTVEQALEVAKNVGYPLMVKASEGGGGKGIRKVMSEAELVDGFRQVQGEVPASPIFLMRMVSNAFHLEVQVLGDEYGEAISLSGRDCSMQRRHQKIIEEGPVIVADPDVFEQMEKAAVRMTKEVGYANAGTLEFLYCDGGYYFLELNPRLQVEHPVTEQITGVNLPVAQLNVAMGIRLHRIPMIRRYYGEDAYGTSAIDFASRKPNPLNGHVIACRITAENPEEGFKPTSGTIKELTFRSTENVWGYFSVSGLGGLHEFADSQFGHLFSHGRTRKEARQMMVLALKELSIRGEVHTPVEYLQYILETDDFKHSRCHTGWLDSLIVATTSKNDTTIPKPDTSVVIVCGALYTAVQGFLSNEEQFLEILQRGQVPLRGELGSTEMDVTLIFNDTKYVMAVYRLGPTHYRVVQPAAAPNGSAAAPPPAFEVTAEVHSLSDGGVLIALDGTSHVCYGKQEVVGLRLTLDGKTIQFSKEYDPSTLQTTAACKLVRYLSEDGANLAKGQAYAEVEVMKMYMSLRVGEAGKISHQAPEGSVLAPGDVIATLELLDPSAVKRVTLFEDAFPAMGLPRPRSTKPHHKLAALRRSISYVLQGYLPDRVHQQVSQLFELLVDARVPLLEFRDVLSVCLKMPDDLRDTVEAVLTAYEASLESSSVPGMPAAVTEFPGASLKRILDEFLARLPSAEVRAEVLLAIDPFIAKVAEYEAGLRAHIPAVVNELLEQFSRVESHFGGRHNREQVLLRLRANALAAEESLESVRMVAQAHHAMPRIGELVITLLEHVEESCWDLMEHFVPMLPTLASLQSEACMEVNQKARHLLIKYQLPSLGQRRVEVENTLRRISGLEAGSDAADRQRRMNNIIHRHTQLDDVLVAFFTHKEPRVREAALDVYIRRTYVNYRITKLSVSGGTLHGDGGASSPPLLTGEWEFTAPSAEAIRLSGPTIDGGDSSSSGAAGSSAGLRRMVTIESVDDLLLQERQAKDGAEAQRPRKGLMVVCEDLAQLRARLESLLAPLRGVGDMSMDLDSLNDDDEDGGAVRCINVLTVFLTRPPHPSPPTSGGTSEKWRRLHAQRDEFSATVSTELKGAAALLRAARIRRITVVVAPYKSGLHPELYTFRESSEYSEDHIYRHIEPSLSHHLELRRLTNYSIERFSTQDQRVHLYFAQEKNPLDARFVDRCFFVRSVVQPGQNLIGDAVDMMVTEGVSAFSEALKALAWATRDPRCSKFAKRMQNHVFLKFTTAIEMDPAAVEAVIRKYSARFGKRLWKHNLREVELLVRLKASPTATPVPIRFIVSNPSGYSVKIHSYMEVGAGADSPLSDDGDVDEELASGGDRFILEPLNPDAPGPDAGRDTQRPYPVMSAVMRKRASANRLNTAYVYDFPELIREANLSLWREHRALLSDASSAAAQGTTTTGETDLSASLTSLDQLVGSPTQQSSSSMMAAAAAATAATTAATATAAGEVLRVAELVLGSGPRNMEPPSPPPGCSAWAVDPVATAVPGLYEVERPIGCNTVGMVAWRMTLNTPEYPGGRHMIVIANDITHLIGSFGLEEDELFDRASRLARAHGFPRVYLSANSGARIGLASEVMDAYKVAWNDPADPSKGFAGLYLDCEDARALGDAVHSQPDEAGRQRITDIIGRQEGLGVENLRGSGMIAGETSRAYEEIFTINLVTGRTVGIGAYLVRLGQRTVQNEGPILLTGDAALNKVLGKEVYTSNVQLGGPEIMYTNGVSHLSVQDELMGIKAILKWISFVPATKGAPLPILSPSPDPVNRVVGFKPAFNVPYDPRHMIAGVRDEQTNRIVATGFFDVGSWVETLGGWAPTAVCGRARLGGIPIGVIAAETRTQNQVIPADPATDTSREEVMLRAGGVWFPDSAYKTAQAIRDFNKEELPLMIFANWRGFSGGMRDMFHEILKFGSYIVDHLCEYQQPVFIYLPPFGELRGGAWVVLDPTINPEMMEMYAAPESRGGVLEASGTVEIKYREKLLIRTMNRLDPQLISLQAELAECLEGDEPSEERVQALKTRIRERVQALIPTYKNVATAFAELHDTPGRMKAKNVISDIIPWETSREFFYHRLKRRLLELQLRKKVRAVVQAARVEAPDSTELLQAWFGRYQSRAEEGASSSATPPTAEEGGKTLAAATPRKRSLLEFFRHSFGHDGDDARSSKTHQVDKEAELSACLELGRGAWSDDRAVIRWLEDDAAQVDKAVSELQTRLARKKMARAAQQDMDSAIAVLASLAPTLTAEQKAALQRALKASPGK